MPIRNFCLKRQIYRIENEMIERQLCLDKLKHRMWNDSMKRRI